MSVDIYTDTRPIWFDRDMSVDILATISVDCRPALDQYETESGCLIVGWHVDWEVTDISPILHWYLATGVFLCFAWQRLNDPNIKPSEIFKAEQKMGITGSLRFWLTLYENRPIYHRQSTDIPPTVNGQRIGRVSAAISLYLLWGVWIFSGTTQSELFIAENRKNVLS